MKIKSVKCRMLAATLDTPIQFGIGAFPTFSATLVEVTTDDGLVGIGECIVRRAPQATRAIVDHMLRPVLLGRDPHDAEGLWDEMFQQLRGWGHYRGFVFEALSGVDTALWDILGKAAGLPVYKVLGGAGRPRVPCYASSVYFAEVKEMAAQAADQARRGHTAIKVKIGRSPQLGGRRMDVSSVKAIREAVGTRVGALVHAHNLRYAPHTGFSAGVSHLASLHVAASVPNLMTYEYFFAPNPLRDLFTEPFPEPREGMIDVPQKPGLGLELDERILKKFKIA